jgi:hypothetical protein
MWYLIIGLSALFAAGLVVVAFVIPAFREPSWRKLLNALAIRNDAAQMRLARRFHRFFPNDPRGWSAIAAVHRSGGERAEAEATLRDGLQT